MSKFQCVLAIEVIPESPTAAEVPPAAGSPQPGPSGLSAPLPGSSSNGSSHPPSRFFFAISGLLVQFYKT